MKLHILIPSILVLLICSCGTPEAHSPVSGDSVTPTGSTEPTLQEKQDNARFIIDSYEDSMEIPHSKISVEYGDARTYLAEIPGIAEMQEGGNEEMEVPADAIASCGCWYAGGGDYYYLLRSTTGITVFHGWLDEMQEDEGYHWEEMKTIE
jgi:hypothetical protein